MNSTAMPIESLPARRSELVVRPLGEEGRYVVKDPVGGAYFHLGEEERFLLEQLDGQQDSEGVCSAFATRFGDPLSADELDQFIVLAQSQGLLRNAECGARNAERHSDAAPGTPNSEFRIPNSRQNLLHWRKSLW